MNLIWAAVTAFGMGAMHSLEPGHGKGVLSAYLVSSRAKARDAVGLGLISAVAHTLSIALLSLIAVSAAETLIPARMTLWVELVSGILIIWIGARMLHRQRHPSMVVVGKVGQRQPHDASCEHGHPHHHHKSITDEPPTSTLRLLTVGFLAGIVPCPSAIAILLAAIGSHQTGIGLGLVAAFSAGSALTMCTVGLLVVQASRYVKSLERRSLLQTAATVSSMLIVLLGGAVALKSILALGS